MNKEICLIGLNYKTAPVEVREVFSLPEHKIHEQGHFALDAGIRECLFLSTCNRVEILTVLKSEGQGVKQAEQRLIRQWAATAGKEIADLKPYIYTYYGAEAIRHLFSVASSLDSMVLGEPQILGQLKDAYRTALKDKTARVILNRLMHKAFSVAKRVRSETGIASSAVSISYAAVELAKHIFDDMSCIRAMLIGAGEMAELAASNLLNGGVQSLVVVNRTLERAEELADRFGASACSFDTLFEALANVDIVISSTASTEPIINAKDIRGVLKKRKNRPMFFIDIAVPRDIDPDVNELDNIYLYDIDDLKDIVEENYANRKQEAIKAEAIVRTETRQFMLWLDRLDLQPTIVELVNRGEVIAQAELQKTLKKIGPISEDMHKAVSAMLTSVVKKMNHAPIEFLKRDMACPDTVMMNVCYVRRVFELDTDCELAAANNGRCPEDCKNSPVACGRVLAKK